MKFTLSWLKDHLETEASLDKIFEPLTMIGLEVEHLDDKAAFKPFVIAKVRFGRKASGCRQAAGPHRRYGRRRAAAGRLRRAECARRPVGAFAAPGTYVPGIDLTLSVGKIRGVESHGMMCSEKELQMSDEPQRHHRPAGGCAGRHELCRLCRSGRSGHRDQPDAEPPGLHQRLRHCPRSCRGRSRHAQGAGRSRLQRSRARRRSRSRSILATIRIFARVSPGARSGASRMVTARNGCSSG